MENPDDIHAFWFADALGDPRLAARRMAWWFEPNAETDRLLAERFTSTVQAASAGALDGWIAQPRSCLALVVVLDQFPRNIHRGTPAAFQRDAQALAAARRGLDMGHVRSLATIEQAFFLMPFQHCEDLACQQEGVALFERMVSEATPPWRTVAQGVLDYARLHLEIIERFGRFPHRNVILGRTATPEELEYLEARRESFGQTRA